jgi:hypothetical protein
MVNTKFHDAVAEMTLAEHVQTGGWDPNKPDAEGARNFFGTSLGSDVVAFHSLFGRGALLINPVA